MKDAVYEAGWVIVARQAQGRTEERKKKKKNEKKTKHEALQVAYIVT